MESFLIKVTFKAVEGSLFWVILFQNPWEHPLRFSLGKRYKYEANLLKYWVFWLKKVMLGLIGRTKKYLFQPARLSLEFSEVAIDYLPYMHR